MKKTMIQIYKHIPKPTRERIDRQALCNILTSCGIGWEFDNSSLWVTGVMMPVHIIAVHEANFIVVSSKLPPWENVEGKWQVSVAGGQARVEIQEIQGMLGAAIIIDHREGFNRKQFVTVVEEFL